MCCEDLWYFVSLPKHDGSHNVGWCYFTKDAIFHLYAIPTLALLTTLRMENNAMPPGRRKMTVTLSIWSISWGKNILHAYYSTRLICYMLTRQISCECVHCVGFRWQPQFLAYFDFWRGTCSDPEPHQSWHGDRGPRACSCTSKTFGDLTHSFTARWLWKFWGNQTRQIKVSITPLPLEQIQRNV